MRASAVSFLGLSLLAFLFGGAAATSTEEVLETLSGIGKTIFTEATDGTIQASIALEDLPPLTSEGPSHFPGIDAIPSSVIAGGRFIVNVVPKIAALIKEGVYQNYVWSDIPVNNALSEIVHKSYEFIGLSWACLNDGIPMAYLPEIFGSASTFPTMDEIAQGKDIYYLHYSGHLKADTILKEGILATDVNSYGKKYIVEPCLRVACLMHEKMAQYFQLGEAGAAVAKMLKVIYDAKPWVFHNKNGGSELGENLSDYPNVLYWLQRVHWLIFQLLCPAVGMVRGLRMRYRRLFPIGLRTKAFMSAKICLGNFDALGIGAGLLYLGSHRIVHPARMLYKLTLGEFKSMLVGYAMSFPNHDELSSRIWNMTEDQAKTSLGRMVKIILGFMTRVRCPNGDWFLMLSFRDVGSALGNVSHHTVAAYARGVNRMGVALSDAQKERGMRGTILDGLQVTLYDNAIEPSFGTAHGDVLEGEQHIPRVLDVAEAIDFCKQHDCERDPETKVGIGSHRSDPAWLELGRASGGTPSNATLLIDETREEVVARFESKADASRALHEDGYNNLVTNVIRRNDGDINKAGKKCLYKNLRVVIETGLADRYGEEMAAELLEYVAANMENLANGGPRLEEYRKDRKDSDQSDITSFFASSSGGGKKPAVASGGMSAGGQSTSKSKSASKSTSKSTSKSKSKAGTLASFWDSKLKKQKLEEHEEAE